MRNIKLKSLRAKILVIILPMIVLSLLLLSWYTYVSSKKLINTEIETKMSFLQDATIETMEKKLTAHMKTTVTLAQTIETAGDVIGKDTQFKDTLFRLIQQYLSTNEETFGVGLWYEPYQLKNYLKLFGAYAYRFNGQILYTEDYNTETYNYHNQPWYKLGAETKEKVQWTDPYYDENSKATILTTVSPFFHYNGKFRGVITANINFEHLQEIVTNIQVGDTGWAFLVDKTGKYIVDRDKDKLLKVNVAADPNPGLAEIGKKMLVEHEGNAIYSENGEAYRVYYKEMPETSWRLALVIPEKELYAPLNRLLLESAAIITLTVLFITGILYYFSRYITIRISKVNQLAANLAEGDFTSTLQVDSSDELGSMAEQLNRMVTRLNSVLRNVYSSSEEVAGTAVQLKANTESTTRAAEEIASSIQEVIVGNDQQQNKTNETKQSVEVTYERLELMSGRIASVSDATKETLSTAVNGNGEIESAVQQIQYMHGKTDEAVQMIEKLSVKSKEINTIIELVSQIALRTKILALNAGIAAAQAGTHGKAFSIIANEIRTLADNSSKAGKQIQDLIEEVQLDIEGTVKVMDQSRLAVMKGREKAESASESFQRIVSAVGTVSSDTTSVADAIQEIHMEMQHMVSSIQHVMEISMQSVERTDSVSAATEEQMASMEEITASANTLSSLASELRASVELFKL